MDSNNNNIPQIYDSTKDYSIYSENMSNIFSSRYNNRFDNEFDNRFNDRFDDRFDDRFNYDRRYDRDYDSRNRYYQYPYCDRYGRCENPIWWNIWPFFFL